ncbi:MAG: mechanosensitive ion channel [Sandaracinaceae bacterium]|nr:mechanosensitive ion channel [Sandaracinaceae bacterium]
MEDVTNILQFLRPDGFVPATLVLLVTYLLARGVAAAFDRMGQRFAQQRIGLHQTKAILRLVLYLAGFVAATSLIFQLSNEALLGLGGVAAVAIGIGLRDLVASIIAGVTILIDKPFSVGDRITYGSTYGEVIEIGLRAVRVVTLDDSVVTIPNNKFLTDVVSSGNAGALDMLIQMDFFVALDADVATAKRILGEALVSSRYAYLKKPWTIVVNEVQQNDFVAVRLRAKVYVLDIRWEKALETDVTERTLAAFQRQGVPSPAILHRSVA